jgi:hypothetical protein
MTPAKRYPSGPITPAGAKQFISGREVSVALVAYDGSIAFDIMGGKSVADPLNPEAVLLQDIKGLIPPWKTLDQKGATEDGITNIGALYDPIEVTADVICEGRDPQHTRQVVRDLIASLDVKQQSELSFTDFEAGRWWSNVRWFKTPPNSLNVKTNTQMMKLIMRADHGFWRSYDDVDMFALAYDDLADTFDADYTSTRNCGPMWPQYYTGTGGGYCIANGSGAATWSDQGGFLTQGREVVNGPYADFDTDTNNQVIEIELGGIQEISFPDSAENHIWGRMGRTGGGEWDGYGIKLQIGFGLIVLSRFNNFVEVEMRREILWPPPAPRERFALVCGFEDKEYVFKAMRNGLDIFTHVEDPHGSNIGADFRGVGWGMRAGAALITQATPAAVTKFRVGDNIQSTQSGFLRRVNVGDQKMWDRYTLFGPASEIRIGNGPNTTDYVSFGPLLTNQVVQIRTDSRKRSVVDLTSTPPTPQELALFQQAHDDYASFATGNNAPVLLQQLQSAFGVVPPQANLYPYLNGRFNQAIPARSPGNPITPYYVSVSIIGGNSDSKVVASGTPLRRYPQ